MIACVTIPQLLWQLAVAAQPDLAQCPLVITTHVGDRAIILDHSPRAARCGVQVGQSVWEARRRCPAFRVTMVPPEQVATTTAHVLEVLHQHADTITTEATTTWTVPLVALGTGFRAAPQIAQQIQRDLHAATGLHCTLALSIQPHVARILARTLPPSTVRIVLPGDEAATLAPLPVCLLPGVGPRTEAQLAPLGVTTIGDLAAIPEPLLRPVLGVRGRSLIELARGQDSGASREIADVLRHTWRFEAAPCADVRRLQAVLYLLAEQIGRDLRQQGVGTGRLTVQLALVDGRTVQRTIPAHARLDLDHDLAQLAHHAFTALQQETRLAVRVVTLHADDLGPLQGDLFTDTDHLRRQRAVDQIKARYGPQAITVAALLPQLQHAA